MDPDEKRLFELVELGNLQGLKELVEDNEAKKKRKRDSLLDAVHLYGWTVLHVAAYNNRPSIIKWLLSSEEGGGRAFGFTNILAEDIWARTALHLAAAKGYLECCQALVEGCNIENGERAELLNAVDRSEFTVLHYAAENNLSSVIRWILSSEGEAGRAAGFTRILTKDKFRRTALHIAAGRGHLECCQALVDGCKIENGERAELLNAADDDGWNALYCAAGNHPSIIQWLLSSEEGGGRASGFTSASITATNKLSQSALHVVAMNRSLECLNALLSGCTVGERLTLFLCIDDQGWTILHHAVCSSNEDIIRELLLRNPETQTIVDHRDNRGMTALHRAVIGGIDEESRKEWGIFNFRNIGQAAVLAALLTVPKKVHNEKEGDQQEQDEGKDEDKDKSQEQQQQAAVVDPNLGTKIE